jgi:hypothetical protein
VDSFAAMVALQGRVPGHGCRDLTATRGLRCGSRVGVGRGEGHGTLGEEREAGALLQKVPSSSASSAILTLYLDFRSSRRDGGLSVGSTENYKQVKTTAIHQRR